MYLIKTPVLVQKFFPDIIWKGPRDSDQVYLSFDDGPSEHTDWLLDILAQYQIKATFFCIGSQIEKFPAEFERIIKDGHVIGNHSYSHYNGWNHSTKQYVEDILRMESLYPTSLFRPPFGKLRYAQYQELKSHFKIVMWNRMPGDFDSNISPSKLKANIQAALKPPNLIVLHDNLVAYKNLKEILPEILEHNKMLDFSNEIDWK